MFSYLRLLLTVVGGPLIARALGPSDRGWFAMAAVIDAVTNQLFSLGLPQALTVWNVTRKSEAASAYGAAMAIIVASIGPAVIIGVATFILWTSLPSVPVKVGFFLVIASSPLTTLAQVRRGVAVSEGRYSAIIAEVFVPTAVQTLIVVALFASGRLTLATAVAGLLLGRGAMVVSLVWGFPVLRGPPKGLIRPIISFSARAWVTTFGQFAVVCVDDIMIFLAMGSAELGVFAVGSTLAMLPEAIPIALGGVLLPAAGRLDSLEGRRYWEHITSLTLGATWVLAICVAISAPTVVPIVFGSPYWRAGWVASIAVFSTPFFADFLVRRARLEATGRPGAAALAQSIGLAVLVIGTAGAVAAKSLYSVAAVSVSSSIVRLAATRVLGRRSGVEFGVPGVTAWPKEFMIVVERLRSFLRMRQAS